MKFNAGWSAEFKIRGDKLKPYFKMEQPTFAPPPGSS
jgi:hypothetical protein